MTVKEFKELKIVRRGKTNEGHVVPHSFRINPFNGAITQLVSVKIPNGFGRRIETINFTDFEKAMEFELFKMFITDKRSY